MAVKMLEKNDPSAVKIGIEGKEVKVSDIYDHEMKIVWPENLPVDIAREIQNLVLGIQPGMTSLHQAIDRYNVLEGMGTSDETIDYLKQEVDDPALSTDRALKVTEVRAKIREILQGLSDMSNKLEQQRAAMGGGMPPNMANNPAVNNPETNTNNMATESNPGEGQRAYPETGREAVVPESTGGKVIPPTGGQ
jgi:hypothetical protein